MRGGSAATGRRTGRKVDGEVEVEVDGEVEVEVEVELQGQSSRRGDAVHEGMAREDSLVKKSLT